MGSAVQRLSRKIEVKFLLEVANPLSPNLRVAAIDWQHAELQQIVSMSSFFF